MQKRFAFSAACLFTVGIFTGLWSAAAITGAVKVELPRLALAAHLNALLGCFWLIAVAFSLPFLGYEGKRLERLYWIVAIPVWANWLITLIASFLGVNGLAYTGNKWNDIIAFLLQAFVVLPSLLAGLYWVRGFKVSPSRIE